MDVGSQTSGAALVWLAGDGTFQIRFPEPFIDSQVGFFWADGKLYAVVGDEAFTHPDVVGVACFPKRILALQANKTPSQDLEKLKLRIGFTVKAIHVSQHGIAFYEVSGKWLGPSIPFHAPMHPCTHAPMHPCTHSSMHASMQAGPRRPASRPP